MAVRKIDFTKRLTIPNPQNMGYRVCLENMPPNADPLIRLENQGERIFAFGLLIDRLGKLEDEKEEREAKEKQKMKRKRIT